MENKALIKTICQAMIAIAWNAEDTVWTPFEDRATGATMCESLADQLEKLGVHEPHIEWFFDIEFGDRDEYQNWILTCIENPGPDA